MSANRKKKQEPWVEYKPTEVWKDIGLSVAVIALLVVLFAVRCSAQQFDYRGVFSTKDILVNWCDSCYLELPPDYLNTEIVLSIQSNQEDKVFKALQAASRGVGWELTRSKAGLLKARPLENVGNLVFISCMDNQPKNVPQYLYSASVKADRLQCAKRDSLDNVQRSRASRDSARADSVARYLDSMSRERLPFKRYELRYYSYTKNFTDKIGAEFSGIVAKGNLHDKFKIFDDWQFFATSTNDTTFTSRLVNVAFDSTLNLDWGTEEQTLKTSYVSSNGYVSNDYEWRKYGLVVTLKKDTAKTYLQYVFRDKEQNISVLQGSAVGNNGDTLVVSGQYTTARQVNTGVPFLSSIPILGLLFSTQQTLTDVKRFELYLVPTDEKKAVQDAGTAKTDGSKD